MEQRKIIPTVIEMHFSTLISYDTRHISGSKKQTAGRLPEKKKKLWKVKGFVSDFPMEA